MTPGGCYGDIWTWIHDEDIHERVFRVWHKTEAGNARGQQLHSKMHLTQFIELPDGDILVGLQSHDKSQPDNLGEEVFFWKLSDIALCYNPSDNLYEEE